MEENKNNAIEKTENLSNNTENKVKSNNKSKKNGKKNVKKSKKTSESKRAKLREQKAEIRHQRAVEKKKAREEKKKLALQKKEDAKKVRMQKAQTAKKARLQKLEARKHKKEDLKALKLQKKAEREKRKEFLKHESKEEKRNRLQREKEAKLELKRERLADNRAKRLEKQEERREKRQLRRQERKEKRNRGIGGWLAAVISLGCAVLVLGSLLTLTFFTPLDEYMVSSTQEEKSFYDLVGYVDNMDVNLSKLVVSKDNEVRQKLLSDIRVQSNLAEASLGELALRDESKFNTSKFINQVGDFCKYLEHKLIDGEKLSEEDIKTLNTMHQINTELKLNLSELASQIDENFDFKSIFEGKEDNLIISKFNELESNATEYPHMIYDGAFADNVKPSESVYLKDLEEVSKLEAEESFKNYFKDYKVKEVELIGETSTGSIDCYDFEGMTEDGINIDAQITKKGGKLLLFNYYKDCEVNSFDEDKLEEIATNYLESIGYTNMKAVWMAKGGNVTSFNFASIVNGVICYSDLIKVNVCNERGIVSGIEATAYLLNHKGRNVETPTVTLEDAEKKVGEEIEVETSRLAIIPYGNTEKLGYEFMGLNNGDTYYIYIDAFTGKELNIFKVVRTTEGTLLM